MCCLTTFSSLSLVTHTTGMTHLKYHTNMHHALQQFYESLSIILLSSRIQVCLKYNQISWTLYIWKPWLKNFFFVCETCISCTTVAENYYLLGHDTMKTDLQALGFSRSLLCPSSWQCKKRRLLSRHRQPALWKCWFL